MMYPRPEAEPFARTTAGTDTELQFTNPSPLDSLFAAQEIIERRDASSSQAAAVAKAKESAAKAAVAAAMAAAADATAARAAATAAANAAAADAEVATFMGKGAFHATAAHAQLANGRAGPPTPQTAPPFALPARVGELDQQVKALLHDYAKRRAQLLAAPVAGAAPAPEAPPTPLFAAPASGSAAPPSATIAKNKKGPGARGLRWRAPRGRMARELQGGMTMTSWVPM